MRQRCGWKSLAAGLAALILAFGAGMPYARAEDRPAEAVNDEETWQFIGIFGSPDEALEYDSLSENGRKKGKETIGEILYEYDLKKITGEKKQDGGQTLKDGESIQFGVRSADEARIFIKAEYDQTFLEVSGSVLQGVKIDAPALLGEASGSPEQDSAEDAAIESETGSATELSPGESLDLRFSKSKGAAVKVEISRSGTQTHVVPVTIRKAGKKALKMKKWKLRTASKPEIGTLRENTETVTAEDENPDAETSAAAEDSQQKKNTGWHRPKVIQPTVPVDAINWGLNQIFIQENRASGR